MSLLDKLLRRKQTSKYIEKSISVSPVGIKSGVPTLRSPPPPPGPITASIKRARRFERNSKLLIDLMMKKYNITQVQMEEDDDLLSKIRNSNIDDLLS